MLVRLFNLANRFPAARRLLWKQVYRYLAGRYRDADWVYMNYGLAPVEGAEPLDLDAADEPDRSWILLYHHVASAIDLRGSAVLEVGSGRGGGASFVQRTLGPATVVGLDISDTAVALCQTRHQVAGLSFQQGDAEALPFADASFDVVLNVESSHCYGSLPRFLAEVKRVLKPGGHFLYADFRGESDVATWLGDIAAAGFTELGRTDITARVLRALDADNHRRMQLLERIIPRMLWPAFHQFAAVPGSVINREFRAGRVSYLSFVLQ